MSENSTSYSGASSLCSNMSNVSINYDGVDVDLDEAIDHIFKELQEHINGTHVQIREMCQWDLRNESYEETLVYFNKMAIHIKEGSALFKDLLSIMKQVMPKKPTVKKVVKTIKE